MQSKADLYKWFYLLVMYTKDLYWTYIFQAFSPKMANQRKNWLKKWTKDSKQKKDLGLVEDYLYHKDTRSISYKDFINKEYILFALMNNNRSIPSMVDGLKPGARKVGSYFSLLVIFLSFTRLDHILLL